MTAGGVLLASAIAIAILMLVTWIISVVITDASIVDIVWGLGFVIVAWVAALVGDGVDERQILLTVLVTVWGLRLAGYLAWRNIGSGEDPRYQAMRRHRGPRFGVISLVTVFALQGVLMWVVSLPVQLANADDMPETLGWLAWAGVALWAIGMLFETVGDAQLARFRADASNTGSVLDTGLWRYTRHPNYFGDFCVWWGIFLVAAETSLARWAIVGPIVMSVLLLRVSGVALLERSITKRRPAYADYIASTNAFFPGPPRTSQR